MELGPGQALEAASPGAQKPPRFASPGRRRCWASLHVAPRGMEQVCACRGGAASNAVEWPDGSDEWAALAGASTLGTKRFLTPRRRIGFCMTDSRHSAVDMASINHF